MLSMKDICWALGLKWCQGTAFIINEMIGGNELCFIIQHIMDFSWACLLWKLPCTELVLTGNWGAAKQNRFGFLIPQTWYWTMIKRILDESHFEKWPSEGSDRQPDSGKNHTFGFLRPTADIDFPFFSWVVWESWAFLGAKWDYAWN